MLKKRDDFEDMLEERRNSSDLRYALKCYTPVLYKGLTPCKVSELKQMVLQSDQLGYVITQVNWLSGYTWWMYFSLQFRKLHFTVKNVSCTFHSLTHLFQGFLQQENACKRAKVTSFTQR